MSGAVTLRSHVNAIHEYFNISDNYFALTAFNNIVFANTYNGPNAGPGLQDDVDPVG